jgi:hypothetical protein
MNRISKNKTVKVRSLVVVMGLVPTVRENWINAPDDIHGGKRHSFLLWDWGIGISVVLRDRETTLGAKDLEEAETLFVLGDGSENDLLESRKNAGSAATLRLNPQKREIEILTSITGLPPVFDCEASGLRVFASDLHEVRSVRGVNLQFSLQGVRDLWTIGYPVSRRTLFEGIMLAPAGSRITIKDGNSIHVERSWAIDCQSISRSWEEYISLQKESFRKAVERIDTSRSFLSLTGGLDTRAILAALVEKGRQLPVATLSGRNTTLDARIARKLCNAYKLSHTTIALNEEFYQNLGSYATEACRLSGGLASVSQAHEVFFYKNAGGLGTARISGNLGNQIGRGGTEGVSMRNADLSLLSAEIHDCLSDGTSTHWYEGQDQKSSKLDFQFLVQNEVTFTSVGNYGIGNTFAEQQAPYSSRELIEASGGMPERPETDGKLSLFRLRARDLHHRFLGETADRSFQVKLIREIGGFVSQCPINWGWRACGGLSLHGLLVGFGAFIDASVRSASVHPPFMRWVLDRSGISGLHEYRDLNQWIGKELRELVQDTLRSEKVRDSGLFDNNRLRKALERQEEGRKKDAKTLIAAIDLGLAITVFDGRI